MIQSDPESHKEINQLQGDHVCRVAGLRIGRLADIGLLDRDDQHDEGRVAGGLQLIGRYR